MYGNYIFETEQKIESMRIEIAKEWALERGMQNTEDMSKDDWIAIYAMLVTKAKLHNYETI